MVKKQAIAKTAEEFICGVRTVYSARAKEEKYLRDNVGYLEALYGLGFLDEETVLWARHFANK